MNNLVTNLKYVRENKNKPQIIAPVIHLNGTSATNLREPLMKAYEAVQAAKDALQDTAPNGRDYYIQGSGALDRAVTEHVARYLKLDEVYQELETLIIAIDEQ